jgi:hypothetical protein
MKAANVTITNLAEVAKARAARPAAFRASKANGKWRAAKWSALDIARERRAIIGRGEQWLWDVPHKEVVKRVPFKGHKRSLERIERAEEVKRCMARMPAMIEAYRQSRKKQEKDMGLMELLVTPREVKGVVGRDTTGAGKATGKN